MTERRSGKRTRGATEENAEQSAADPDSTSPPVEATPQERKLSGRVELGPFCISIPNGWRFYPMEDRLACRPLSGVGVMQITMARQDQLPANATHEMFMHTAKEASGYNLDGPGIDKAKEAIDQGQAGGESFRAGRDFVRVWYHRRPEGLILAWFAVPTKRIAERSVARLIGQSDKMIASLRLAPVIDA